MKDYTGLAALIGSVLGPVVVVITLHFNTRKVAQVVQTVDRVETVVAEVSHAVNGKDPRDTTISEDMITVRDKQERDRPSRDETEVALLPMVKQLVIQVAELRAQFPNGREWLER